jgi:hypothetical protein
MADKLGHVVGITGSRDSPNSVGQVFDLARDRIKVAKHCGSFGGFLVRCVFTAQAGPVGFVMHATVHAFMTARMMAHPVESVAFQHEKHAPPRMAKTGVAFNARRLTGWAIVCSGLS